MTPEMHIAVERKANCTATFRSSQVVSSEKFGVDFSGFIEIYILTNHPTATIAFIWETGDRNRKYDIVLGPPIVTAEEAIKSKADAFGRSLTDPD